MVPFDLDLYLLTDRLDDTLPPSALLSLFSLTEPGRHRSLPSLRRSGRRRPPFSIERILAALDEFEAGDQDISPINPQDDNVTQELLDLARAGDEAEFRALAACLMPVEEISECWAGCRARLGLSA